MRAVFLGTPACAVPSLEALLAAEHDVPLVVTQPPRPVGRSATPAPPPVQTAALHHGIEVIHPVKIRKPPFLEKLRAARPDVLVVVAYGRILPPAVLELPRLGPVNVHFSLLPRYRGAAPVQWALANAEESTGVTTMLMSEGMDEGDLLLQEATAIEAGLHAPALTERLARIGASLLVRTLTGLEAGALEPRAQDSSLATYAPRLRREDGVADFSLPAKALEGRVRGFDPWPGLWAVRAGKRLRIVDAESRTGPSRAEPEGRVLGIEGETLEVACGEGTILAIKKVQPEGRRAMTARDAVNGRQLRPGDQLEGSAQTT